MKFLNNKGQGLIELLVSIAVIEIGIFSVWSLFLVNFNSEREAEMRIVGVNLAREGVEVVKNIRDSNWLKNASNKPHPIEANNIWPWDQYLIAGNYSIDYARDTDGNSLAAVGSDSGLLYTDSNKGYYTNIATDNKPTPYKRIVRLKDIYCADNDNNFKCDSDFFTNTLELLSGSNPLKIGVNVVSDVEWEISDRVRHSIVEDNLYNWK
ncbi:MAG: hypothetical protein WCT26_01300 [Candidatus Buchananbacteria bacterium]|jgi:hypothetical protein